MEKDTIDLTDANTEVVSFGKQEQRLKSLPETERLRSVSPESFLEIESRKSGNFSFFFLLSPWCSEMDCFHMTVTLKCLSVKQMCFSPKEWQPQLFLQRLQKKKEKKETLPICKTKLWRKLWIIPICLEEIIKIGVTEMLGRGRPFFETHKRLLKSQNNKLLQ